MDQWRWPAQADKLPVKVEEETSSVELVRIVCYPYWLIEVLVHVKAPLLPRAVRRWLVAVDGLTGVISVPPPVPPVTAGDDSESVVYVEPKITVADIDHDRLRRAAVDQVARRLRAWMNVTIEVGESRVVYKEIRLFDVRFRNESRATLALDSLTGEYGIVRRDWRPEGGVV